MPNENTRRPGLTDASHASDIAKGERFGFGANWARFLSVLDEERIDAAVESLRNMLGVHDLKERTFLDIGSGSGLFSLAARRLGARVHSFDYDPQSVACTQELRRRYFRDDAQWVAEQGSALDAAYLASLGYFDVVYSWGVLHHTGSLWLGIEHALQRVGPGGQLYIAIYNDQGWWSRVWWLIKHFYNKLPSLLKPAYAYGVWYTIIGLNVVKYTVKLQPMNAIRPLIGYKPGRGMSVSHDIVDWMGGFPFEVARYDLLIDYLQARGFTLTHGSPNYGMGCHELVAARV